jgi:TPR repeat protein
MRFGEALVFGRGVVADKKQGIGLIKTAAEGGNSAAMVLLADLQMRGLLSREEQVSAVSLLENAAAKGQLVALVKLGSIYQAGDLVKADPAKAVGYYRKAIAAGRADAMIALGRAFTEGKLKGQGSPSEGIALLKQAQELKNENAVIVLSDSYMYGRGVRRNPKEAIALLKAASDGGNLKADLKLVTLYRDGRKGVVNRNLPLARTTLEKIAGKLPPADLKAERVLLQSAEPGTKARYTQLAAEFDDLPVESRSALLRRIRNTSLGLYIYLVQSRLNQMDLYKGAKDGVLSRATTRAIYNNCIRREQPQICGKGPLSPRVIEVTAMAFQDDHDIAGLEKQNE